MKPTYWLVIACVIALGIAGWLDWKNRPAAQAPSQVTSQTLMPNVPFGPMSVTSTDVTYYETYRGYFARPDDHKDYPGVVMIHEWWGLNDNIKEMAKVLASNGYLVLAVDLYGQSTASSTVAQQLSSSINQAEAIKNMQAAAKYLQDRHATKLASFGWCFGGGQSLQLALSGEKLAATVIYYGQPVTDQAQLKKITWPVLGIYGEKDQAITIDKSRAFAAALQQAGIKSEFHFYPNVGHAFANPSNPGYAPQETKDAWEKTLSFLKTSLQ